MAYPRPFLCWLIAMPLAVVFYVGGRWSIRVLITLGGLALHAAGFYTLSLSRVAVPEHVPLAKMVGPFVGCVLCATVFVSAMALHCSGIVAAKQSALLSEVESHRATERRLLEAMEEAERANRAKSEFLAKMSHELRTPLNGIIGFSQIIASELLGPVGTRKSAGYGTDIERSGHHLLQMIGEILDLAKIETGKFILHEGEFDLAAIVRETIELMRPLAAARGVSTTFEPLQPGARLRADDLRVRQILLNLLWNAAKFTKAGGSVAAIAARERGAGISVAVADTGVGIPAADLERVLQAFERVGNAMISNSGGTGLGLPLARELMLLHGGNLTLAKPASARR